MRKTARSVVWEGAGAQSPAPDPIGSSNPAGANMLGMTLSLPMSRREVVRVGLFGIAGLLLDYSRVFGAEAGEPLQSAQPLEAGPAVIKAKSVIQIFLWGGMSHNDTWDPKPDAGYDYNGSMKNLAR